MVETRVFSPTDRVRKQIHEQLGSQLERTEDPSALLRPLVPDQAVEIQMADQSLFRVGAELYRDIKWVIGDTEALPERGEAIFSFRSGQWSKIESIFRYHCWDITMVDDVISDDRVRYPAETEVFVSRDCGYCLLGESAVSTLGLISELAKVLRGECIYRLADVPVRPRQESTPYGRLTAVNGGGVSQSVVNEELEYLFMGRESSPSDELEFLRRRFDRYRESFKDFFMSMASTSVEGCPFKGDEVIVALLDTGIDRSVLNVENFKNFVPGECPDDPEKHGTLSAALIHAERPYGIAPESNLMMAKVMRGRGDGAVVDIVSFFLALHWSITNGCNVLVTPLSFRELELPLLKGLGNTLSDVYQPHSGQMLWVSAINHLSVKDLPAGLPDVLGVSIHPLNHYSPDHTLPQQLVHAPKRSVYSSPSTPPWRYSGVSASTAFVGGVAALWYQYLRKHNPSVTAEEVKRQILKSRVRETGLIQAPPWT